MQTQLPTGKDSHVWARRTVTSKVPKVLSHDNDYEQKMVTIKESGNEDYEPI